MPNPTMKFMARGAQSSPMANTYTKKDGELRKRLVSLKARQDGQEQQKTEIGDTAMKVLELHNSLKISGLARILRKNG